MSIGRYQEQVAQAVDGRAEIRFVERWGSEPGFVALLAERLLPPRGKARRLHRALAPRPHPRRRRSVSRRAARDGRPRRRGAPAAQEWTFSFQSESPTGEPWLGPDIIEHLNELAACDVRDVVLCPVGFVADHLEIRWDLDIVAAEHARELGIRLDRIELPNADPAFIEVLAGLVRRHAAVPSVT